MKTIPGTPLQVWNQANNQWKGPHHLKTTFTKGHRTKEILYSYVCDIPTKTGDDWLLESVEDEET